MLGNIIFNNSINFVNLFIKKDESKTTYELRNVCVPQEFQLSNDELCEGWEQWELGTPFIGRRID